MFRQDCYPAVSYNRAQAAKAVSQTYQSLGLALQSHAEFNSVSSLLTWHRHGKRQRQKQRSEQRQRQRRKPRAQPKLRQLDDGHGETASIR